VGTQSVRRYALVPDPPEQSDGLPKPVRRYHLARIAVSPHSALGANRHGRMEEVAGRDADDRDGR
jgi:hypothetical protein